VEGIGTEWLDEGEWDSERDRVGKDDKGQEGIDESGRERVVISRRERVKFWSGGSRVRPCCNMVFLVARRLSSVD